MIKKIIFVFLILLLTLIPQSNATNEQTIEEQKNTFEINQFINNSEEYVNKDFMQQEDLNSLLNSAIKGQVNNKNIFTKIFGIFGKEFKNSMATLSSILAIIVIHSILKMTNFSDVIAMIKTATANMVGFINVLVPLLTTLMVFTGSITTTSMVQPVMLFTVNFIGNLIQTVLIPIVLAASSLSIISKVSDRIQIDRLSKLLKSGVNWFLVIGITIFVSIITLEGGLSSSVDGISAKTTKAVVSSAIPIIGKILGDAVDSVLGCGVILKNAVGIVGVVIILGICIGPIIKLALAMISYKIIARYLPTYCRRKNIKAFWWVVRYF